MRLIDADALIEAMKKTESEYQNAMTGPSWLSAFNVISEQPTAYDIDKVVEELNTMSQLITIKDMFKVHENVKMVATDIAIEIVKHGVVGKDVE